ncbi:hypothetical protein E2562_023690 [Oryza meyeriana var. granulata]|uniref:Uncharacterized protein n=1 Tax=Oryza meyeriana var. granulata TaxID=110450 RepID=A0A6G1BN89_9ORYZ|nr:hypothetical protein E2562_023690 [Oryza meyeriana var. granulata]
MAFIVRLAIEGLSVHSCEPETLEQIHNKLDCQLIEIFEPTDACMTEVLAWASNPSSIPKELPLDIPQPMMEWWLELEEDDPDMFKALSAEAPPVAVLQVVHDAVAHSSPGSEAARQALPQALTPLPPPAPTAANHVASGIQVMADVILPLPRVILRQRPCTVQVGRCQAATLSTLCRNGRVAAKNGCHHMHMVTKAQRNIMKSLGIITNEDKVEERDVLRYLELLRTP